LSKPMKSPLSPQHWRFVPQVLGLLASIASLWLEPLNAQTRLEGKLGLESEIGALDWYLNDRLICESCSEFKVFSVDTGTHRLAAKQNGASVAQNKVYVAEGHQRYSLVAEGQAHRIRFRGEDPPDQTAVSVARIHKAEPKTEITTREVQVAKLEAIAPPLVQPEIKPQDDADGAAVQKICGLPHQYERLKAAVDLAESRELSQDELKSLIACLSHDYTKLEFLRSISPRYQKRSEFASLSSTLEYEWTRAAFAESLNQSAIEKTASEPLIEPSEASPSAGSLSKIQQP